MIATFAVIEQQAEFENCDIALTVSPTSRPALMDSRCFGVDSDRPPAAQRGLRPQPAWNSGFPSPDLFRKAHQKLRWRTNLLPTAADEPELEVPALAGPERPS